MQMNGLRKTHPMVLIAAVAITIFSLLGSAVITGLIPNAYPEKQGAIEQSTISNDAATATNQAAPSTRSDSGSSPHITDYKSKVQPHGVKPNSRPDKSVACDSCGKIVSISAAEQEGNGFRIKIRMENGSYHTITQYNEPHYRVGDQVKLISRQVTIA